MSSWNSCKLPLLVVVMCFCSVHFVNGQSISYDMGFLNDYSSMRSKALGYSTVAMSGYTGAAEINPASLGLENTIQGSTFILDKKKSLFSRDYGFDTSLFQPYVDIKKNRWAAAVYMDYLNLGEEYYTNEKGEYIGKSHSYQQSVSFSGAYEFFNNFSVGMGIHYIISTLGVPRMSAGNPSYEAHAFAIDLGVLYKKTYDLGQMTIKPSAGWSLTNFGTPLHYAPGQSDPLPLTMQAGLGVRFITKYTTHKRNVFNFGLYASLSHILARKDANGHAYGPFEALIKGWSPFIQSTYPQKHISFADQFYTHLGIEITFLGIFSVREGYINRQSVTDPSGSISFGFGVTLHDFSLDYTKYPNVFGPGNHVLQFGLHIPFQ